MARKHEHFGLNYLEELKIVKERENICKETRQDFLKFKQEYASDHGNINKALQEDTPSGQSFQKPSKTRSPFLCTEIKQLFSEWDTSKIQKKVRISCDEEETIKTEDTASQSKKSSKKQNHTDGKKKAFHTGKAVSEHKSESPGDEGEKLPVLIASFVGTTKQMTILKKPGPLKPKSPKVPCAKLQFKDQSKYSIANVKQLEQKILSQHIILPTVGTNTADFDDSCSIISSVSEKSTSIPKETSESNIPSHLERSYSTKTSTSSSIKFSPAYLEETTSESRIGISKSRLKSSFSKAHLSVSKLPSGIISRSIDEIIESLKSTVPTASDLKIKELLESILGQDYLINIQQANELELSAVRMATVESDSMKLKSSHIRKDRFVSPSVYQGIKQILEESEQDIPESSQLKSYSPQVQPSEVREYIARIEVPDIVIQTATKESDYTVKTVSPDQQSIHGSEYDLFSEAEVTESIAEKSKSLLDVSSEEKSEDFASSGKDLIIQGKAFPKTRPVQTHKKVEDLQYQQPVSLLSTWTTKIKDVDYPLIHLLCTTSPGFVLPRNLQLVSRVHHTLDKSGHGISLPPINFDCHNSEELFPETAAFEKKNFRERIYNEGLPISEVCQSSQEDGIQVLPPKTPRSMPEWQRIAEFYVEKPQLKLLGKTMKLQPGSLKMFWTPAPHKFSAPLSVMKEILFSKYESNLVHGVIYEDFSIDLQEKEKGEGEDDFDSFFSNISANRRHGSFPELVLPETTVKDEDIACGHSLKRTTSAPELSSYRDKTLIKFSANFNTAMEELDIMSKHVPLAKPTAAVPEAEPTLKKHSFPANLSGISFHPSKAPINPEKGPETLTGSPLKLPKGNLFEPVPAPGEIDQTALADECRKAGIKYIIFPKKKRRSLKLGKSITPKVLDSIFQKLNEPPKVLKRSTSLILQNLHMHKKYSIKVSRAIQLYRNPSLPYLLNFETFAQKQGKGSEDSDYLWARLVWNKWFEERFVSKNKSDEDKQMLGKHLLTQEIEDVTKERELPNYVNPFLFDGKKEELEQCEQEIERITQEINKGCATAFNYCRRGAIYRKIGKMQSALDDLEKAIHLEPFLANAYWHRHLIFVYQNKIIPALEDLNFIIKCNVNYTDAYLSRAEIYRKQGNNHLTKYNFSLALRYRPTDPEVYFKRGEVHEEEGELLLAMEDYSKVCIIIFNCIIYVTFFLQDALSSFNEALLLLGGIEKYLPNTFETAELYFLMGECYMEQVFLLEACDAFTSAVRVYPRYADAFYQRGLCRMQLQQSKCILDFNKTLAIIPRHFQAYLSRAAYYGSKGRYSKAIMNCTEALKIERQSIRGYLYRGVLKFYNRTYKRAVEDLTKAIELDKTCILAYYNRAIAFQQLKDYENSLIDYKTVLRLEASKDIVLKVLKNRAIVFIEMKQYEHALKDFAEVAMTEHKNIGLLNVIGLCYHRLQKYEEAVESFSKVLKLNPFSLDAYIGRGNAYLEYGHSKGTRQALKDFLTAVHINPVSIKARLCLGYSLQALGKFQKAWIQFSAAIHCDPSCHNAYDARAIVCLQMGDVFAAFQDTNAALKITTNAELLTNRGVINQFMGYLNCAMQDYQHAITKDPNYALAYFNAANVYFLNKQFSQANDYYNKAIERDPQNESAFLNRAITNTLLRNFEEAKTDFEMAISLSPLSAAVYFNKANLYNMLQQYDQAEEDISKALSIQPYDALLYKLRADIRGKMGLIKEAIADYKKAISIQELISSN
ncbi:PREDICTED: tetratricopeptide repeat protein 6 [Thamnophis sirtalis]|uniref:Tetratricopeptide repeat protein 6 n=1 Tax=Thamnophis sirtalis TaxID=35019 RepID=A0A6I9X5C0_9SAUR|nr:PREDICTED: tetratricopeptide repeat protein 6 [Thamnophis sirtalis]